MDYKLLLKKYKQQGDVTWEYHPLRNLKDAQGHIKDFKISNKQFNLNLENPVDIECQAAYDGTVNLILNDDVNPPRIINSRWTRTENNTYKVINREQVNQSNVYSEEFVDRQTRLFRNINGVTKIDLYNVTNYGKLKAGNYIIYLKYMDDDYNETDIASQTGVISIFNGTPTNPKTVSGGLMDEETDKSILLTLRDLDTSFTYFKLYVYRTTCDSNGIKLDYAYKIDTDYEITDSTDSIYINGYEEYVDISVEELNINYNIADSVKTQAQVQNMLFFGNITEPLNRDADLQDLSLYIKAEEAISEDSIGFIDPSNYSRQKEDDAYQVEYYSPMNIYYKLGYWPDEMYRFGIVYIYNDDHLSPVYNLRGVDFSTSNVNIIDGEYSKYENRTESVIPFSDNWLNTKYRTNTKGVFRFSKRFDEIIHDPSPADTNSKKKGIYPLYIKFSLHNGMIKTLQDKKIKGFFFVRQNRVPTILCQGYTVGVDKAGYFPMLYQNKQYIVESFKSKDGSLLTSVEDRIVRVPTVQSSGLLCVDAYCDKKLQSMFDTSEFKLEQVFSYSDVSNAEKKRHYYPFNQSPARGSTVSSLVYIDPEIPQKVHNDKGFSTKAGMQEDLKYSAYIGMRDPANEKADITRGIFTAFIGATQKLADNSIYNIRSKNYNESNASDFFEIRMNDKSPFYAVSERYCIAPDKNATDYKLYSSYIGKAGSENMYDIFKYDIYRGDCFTNTVTTRMHRNFTSSSVPINDTIIDIDTWNENYKGVNSTDWNKMNKADVDAVPIGTWMTYKCMSNFNLSLRSIDPFQIDEQALMGNPRSFYPLQDISTKSSNKINESNLMNSGYNSLLGIKRNFTSDVIPYTKDVFDTRIMFSNIQVDGAFKNSYKVFQGLSYEDLDRQYGAITKIIPWGVNLFCVFEHGLAIIPVNEKALLQTTAGANIHMYGSGVLQKQVVLISDQYGSIWKDSIIKTPVAIYGVDTDSHKIWRYSDEKKLEIISDFSMQRYLHDNIDLKEIDKYTILGTRNVKTHYNAFKRDVMFTYYNKDKIWNICYNETLGKWITRYSWTPFMSENIDHSMFSFDLLRTRIFGLLNTNLGKSQTKNPITVDYISGSNGLISNAEIDGAFDLKMNNGYDYYNINNINVKGFYWDRNHDRIKSEIIYSCDNFNEEYDNITLENGELDVDSIINKYTKTNNGIINYNIFNINPIQIKDGSDVSLESQMYKIWEKLNQNNYKHNLKLNIDTNSKYLYYNVNIDYTPYTVAKIEDLNSYSFDDQDVNVFIIGNETKSYSVAFIDISKDSNDEYTNDFRNALINSIFVHGRSINADEINYFDSDSNNQCLPTKWYDSQEPFEFEVVINEPKGMHKIFDNLMIISNNVEPESFEVEITGDVYGFDKKMMYKDPSKSVFENICIIPANKVKENIGKDIVDERLKKEVNTRIHWDHIENSYSLSIHQDSVNIKDYGRRLGNIYYNEDKWYITLRPIYYKDITGSLKSTRIRDKYAKIRVKYSGENLAIIVALQSLFTLSYV